MKKRKIRLGGPPEGHLREASHNLRLIEEHQERQAREPACEQQYRHLLAAKQLIGEASVHIEQVVDARLQTSEVRSARFRLRDAVKRQVQRSVEFRDHCMRR